LAKVTGVADWQTSVYHFLGIPTAKHDWTSVSEKVVDGANRLKTLRSCPGVLVVDGADLIAKADPVFFKKLLGFAKFCAYKKCLRVVFVISDDRDAEALVMTRKYFGRVSFLEVGDLDDEEAVQCLTRSGMESMAATQVVQRVTGGRLHLLKLVADRSPAEVRSWESTMHRTVSAKYG
jgi:hypothetical protein